MFKKILASILLLCSFASAKDLSVQEIRERFELRADIYQMDGKKVMGTPDRTNYWRMRPDSGDLTGDWSSSFGNEGTIAIRYVWKVDSDGSIKATIEEFGKASKDPGKPGNSGFSEPLLKKEYTLENFEPIVWKVLSIKNKNYIVRFIPSIRDNPVATAIDNLPVSGKNLSVTDNNGFLWMNGTDLEGKYIGMTTHRGTIVLSYTPFKGAKEIGVAEDKEIVLKVDKKYEINIRSETSFLPARITGKVYAIYLPEKKSKSVNSVHSFSTSSEENLLKNLEKR